MLWNRLFKKIVMTAEEMEKRRKAVSLNIPILGEGKKCGGEDCNLCYKSPKPECGACGYCKRIVVRNELIYEGHIAYLPEGTSRYSNRNPPDTIKPLIQDKFVIPEADIILVFPESPGSINEYATYFRDPVIAPKMRVFIDFGFHPWHSKEKGRHAHTCIEFGCRHGHLHPYDGRNRKQLVYMVKDIIYHKQMEIVIEKYDRRNRVIKLFFDLSRFFL
jgi:hypothetical protein